MNATTSSPLFFLKDLGRALRWLRERQTKKQYLVADAAGVTKGMLSAYETGRQKPSLDTLEKLLAALGCDLNDLHNALQVVTERPERICTARRSAPAPSGFSRQPQPEELAERGYFDVASLLGIVEPLPSEQKEALEQILDGCHRLVRHLFRTLDQERIPSAELERNPL